MSTSTWPMNVAAETCDCVAPMIHSGWLVFLGAIAVVGPALIARVVHHRRRRAPELPTDDTDHTLPEDE